MPLPSIFPRISSVIPTAPSTNPATVTGGDGSSRAATFGNISSVDAAGCSAASVQATETAAGGSSGNNYDVEFYNEEGEDRRKVGIHYYLIFIFSRVYSTVYIISKIIFYAKLPTFLVWDLMTPPPFPRCRKCEN